MAAHHTKRQKKLQSKLRKSSVPAMLITNEHNVTYLTGFTGDSSYLVVTPNSTLLLSDTRYETQLTEECPELDVYIRDAGSTKLDSAVNAVEKSKFGQLFVEADSMTKSMFDQLESSASTCELVPTSGWVEEFRCIKDKVEMASIRKSVMINERAFEVIRSQLSGEQTERQIAHNLEHQIRAFGGARCAFNPIVGVGPRAALPHGVPSNVKIKESFMVLIDWGAQVDLYASDLTRVLVTGRIQPKFRRVYETVLKAQLAAIKLIKPGVSLQKVDQAARKVIADAGFGKYFGHGLGHSFGLQIHETPFMSPIHKGTLEAGMVITVEPGIYIPGWSGVRIEDDVLVTRDGHEVLSSLPKKLDECVVNLF
jgi:Xaa-Pro aminopeptidase